MLIFKAGEDAEPFLLPDYPALKVELKADGKLYMTSQNLSEIQTLVLLHLAQDEVLRRLQHNKPPDAEWGPIEK